MCHFVLLQGGWRDMHSSLRGSVQVAEGCDCTLHAGGGGRLSLQKESFEDQSLSHNILVLGT